MTYQEYYQSRFRRDLASVMAGAVEAGVGHHISDPEPALQPSSVGQGNAAIRALGALREDLFAVALFWTVLVDQVAYTHFRDHYAAFRALTAYPKFRGDCTQACYYHLRPGIILETVGRPSQGEPWRPIDRLLHVLRESEPVMEREIGDFFKRHLQTIDRRAFWRHCAAEVPARAAPPPA